MSGPCGFAVVSFRCTDCRETTDVHGIWPGQCLGEWRLEGSFGTGRDSVKSGLCGSLFVARLSEGLMVRVLRNAVMVGMQRGRPLELSPHLLLFYHPLMVGDCGTWWNDTLCRLRYPSIHRPKCHCTHHRSHLYYAGITFGSRGESPLPTI